MLATFHVVYFISYKVQPRFKTSSAQETFVQGSSNISNEDYSGGAMPHNPNVGPIGCITL